MQYFNNNNKYLHIKLQAANFFFVCVSWRVNTICTFAVWCNYTGRNVLHITCVLMHVELGPLI